MKVSIASCSCRIAAAFLAAACASSDRNAAFTVNDSAGVSIVRSVRPLWGPHEAWRVDSTPEVSFGAEEDDSLAMLQRVVGAMRRADGTFAVGDGGSSQVKYYDSRGHFLHAVGRRGQGPSEYEYLAWLKGCGGDSAFVMDIGNRRVSVLTSYGRSGRTLTLKTSEANGTPFTTICRRDGRFLTSGWGDLLAPPRSTPYRPSVAVDIIGADGITRHTLGQFPGTEMVPMMGGAGPRRGGRWLRLALSMHGAWVAPDDGRGILEYDSLGTLIRIVHPHSSEHALTRDDQEFLRALVVDSLPLDRDRRQREAELRTHDFPKFNPSFLEIVADAEANLWVQDFPRAAEPDPTWNVYRHDGVWLGGIHLPPRLRVLEIGATYILGIRTAANGADEVALFTLRRSGAAP